jgi:D-glucosaminate-6-phosphate ammonia-lyase
MEFSTGSVIFDSLGINRIINGRGWITVVGGSIMPPEVVTAMSEATDSYVDLPELNLAAGRAIAGYTGAEAGLVVAGAGAGLLLQAAACITGTDPVLMNRLPDTEGVPNEVHIYKDHLTNYTRCYRAAGAKLVVWGEGDGPADEQLAAALGPKTAALAYVFHPWNSCPLTLEQAVEIAHARGVPVVVDAAVMLPPVSSLTTYIEQGADMVTFSGGKGLRGPQSSGILCGRADLIEAARLNNAPNHGIGRPAKVCKEEIVGLIAALDLFVKTDHEAEWATWRDRSAVIASAIDDIPGLEVKIEDNDPNRQGPAVAVYFRDGWQGADAEAVLSRLAAREPSIRAGSGSYENELFITPVTLKDGEEHIVARALREDLLA